MYKNGTLNKNNNNNNGENKIIVGKVYPLPTHILPPWHENDLPSHWVGREEELKKFILSISESEYTFRLPKSELKLDDGTLFQYELKRHDARSMSDSHADDNYYKAALMLQIDPKLAHIRFMLATVVDEESFWSSYFYFVNVIKRTKRIHLLKQKIKELQEHARTFCSNETIIYKQLAKEIKLSFQAVEQCLSIIDILLLKKPEALTNSDIKHMEECFQECVQRKFRLSELIANDLANVNKQEEKILFEQMYEANNLFQNLMENHDQFEKHLQQKIIFIPKLFRAKRDPPSVTTVEQRQKICSALPLRFQKKDWTLIYSSLENGTSINTLLKRTIKANEETLTIVQTTKGIIFGAFLGEPFTISGSKYYGNGETMLFSFAARDNCGNQLFKVYKWSKMNEYFVRSSEIDGITFGGGSNGKCGLYIDSSLLFGKSHACETFDSQCLNRDPSRSANENCTELDEDFDILAVEIWGFNWQKEEEPRKRGQIFT